MAAAALMGVGRPLDLLALPENSTEWLTAIAVTQAAWEKARDRDREFAVLVANNVAKAMSGR
ncbi:MAG: hypothetical protein M3Y91_06890 [Actinomycetota bacterium]|nr:hypothetical protein [Actinomycetota bacterium]